MTNGLYTTGVGLVPQMYKQEIIANNLANISTTGYKKDGLFFKKLLNSKLIQDLNLGDGNFLLEVKEQYTDFQQGSLLRTGNDFDIALEGKGFFNIQTPNGTAYSRNGNFTINSEGVLVTNVGYPVLGENGEIELDTSSNITITKQGEIFSKGMQVDNFVMTNFNRPDKLKKSGNSLFIAEDETIEQIPADGLSFHQKHLEQSNVNAVKEMVEMILSLRRFESMQKTLKLQNDSLGKAVNELGRGK